MTEHVPSTSQLVSDAEIMASNAEFAALDFPALDIDLSKDMKSREDFLSEAGDMWKLYAIGSSMLTKSADELTSAVREMDNSDDELMFRMLDDFGMAKDWFAHFHQIMNAVCARAHVAAARVVEGPA